MRVRVSQAGQNGSGRKIDQAIARTAFSLGERADTDDLAALDHDGLVGEGLAAADVQEFAGADDDTSGLLRRCHGAQEQ